jgi:hypothetical protein
MLPSVAKTRQIKKFTAPVPTSVPPITITTSLGDGGKMFSINAKRKSVMYTQTAGKLEI